MNWLIFAFGSAIFATLYFLVAKKTLYREDSLNFVTSITLIIFLMTFVFIPYLKITKFQLFVTFLIALICSIASFFSIRSMKHMEISAVIPLTNLSPLLIALLSWLMLKEAINLMQGVGMIFLVAGAYVLETKKIKKPKEFFQKIIKNKYIHFILFSLVLYSLSALGQRFLLRGTLNRFSFFFFFELFLLINLSTLNYLYNGGFKSLKKTLKKSGFWILLASFFAFFSDLTLFYAISLANVALVIAIKRSSTLFTTIIGGELFHDHQLKRRIIACLIMVVGVIMVSI